MDTRCRSGHLSLSLLLLLLLLLLPHAQDYILANSWRGYVLDARGVVVTPIHVSILNIPVLLANIVQ